MIPEPSLEQRAIIEAISRRENVIVDAVAGSGKTTTVLGIAKALPDQQVWQITFNAQLKCEVRTKAQGASLDNLKIHTYHSLATALYDRTAHTDAKIIHLLQENRPIGRQVPRVDVLIIDEAQDMTMLYFRLIRKFIQDLQQPELRIAIFGDRYQGVYEFMKADTRFLTLAEQLWGGAFTHLTLKESYRLTQPIAWFVNHSMVGSQRIVAQKKGPRVEWYIGDMFKLKSMFLASLIKEIKENKLKPEDVFVLCASLKGAKTPVKAMENVFVEHKIPVYVPISEECKLDEDVTRGKVVFATFPSSKGRERPVVIIMGFDENYFNFFAKESPRDVCPPCLYVAVTRASRRLILVGSKQAAPLPFVSRTALEFNAYVSLVNEDMMLRHSLIVAKSYDKTTSPTELMRFLKQETIEHLEPLVKRLFTCVAEPAYEVRIPSKVTTSRDLHEDVSDLNGLAIPAIWEHRRRGVSTIEERIWEMGMAKVNANIMKKAPAKISKHKDFLHLCNMYLAMTEGYHGRLAQITSYEWLTSAMVNKCLNSLDELAKGSVAFECSVDALVQTQFGAILMRGYVDMIDDMTVWELKCVDHLQLEHYLQLVAYYYMYHRSTKLVSEHEKTFKLLNLRTGELHQLIPNENDIDRIMTCLYAHKYQPITRATDEEFITMVSKVSKPIALPPPCQT